MKACVKSFLLFSYTGFQKNGLSAQKYQLLSAFVKTDLFGYRFLNLLNNTIFSVPASCIGLTNIVKSIGTRAGPGFTPNSSNVWICPDVNPVHRYTNRQNAFLGGMTAAYIFIRYRLAEVLPAHCVRPRAGRETVK